MFSRKAKTQMRALRREMQIVFQDPYGAFNPRMTVGQIIGEALDLREDDEAKAARQKLIGDYLETVQMPRGVANRYPHEFSGGQRQRIGIARALAVNPKFIVADEPVSALDVSTQAEIVNLLLDLQQRLHLTMLFISHDLSVVRVLCDRVAVMSKGEIVEQGSAAQIFENPQQQYTRELLAAIPIPDPHAPRNRSGGRKHKCEISFGARASRPQWKNAGGRPRSLLPLFVAVALSGCGNNPYPPGESAKPVLFYSKGDDPRTLDPTISYSAGEALIVDAIYPAYFHYHYLKQSPFQLDLEIGATKPEKRLYVPEALQKKYPDFAYSKSTPGIGEEWIFKLRDDLRFQDDPCFPDGKGRKVVAADVIYAFRRMADPSVECPVVSFFADKIIGFDKYFADNLARIKKEAKSRLQCARRRLISRPERPAGFSYSPARAVSAVEVFDGDAFHNANCARSGGKIRRRISAPSGWLRAVYSERISAQKAHYFNAESQSLSSVLSA